MWKIKVIYLYFCISNIVKAQERVEGFWEWYQPNWLDPLIWQVSPMTGKYLYCFLFLCSLLWSLKINEKNFTLFVTWCACERIPLCGPQAFSLPSSLVKLGCKLLFFLFGVSLGAISGHLEKGRGILDNLFGKPFPLPFPNYSLNHNF